MTTLEEKIKLLERELALKNAYLSVQFSFPKMSKLPEDVRNQVVEELKKACAQLAEDKEAAPTPTSAPTELTAEDLKILKELANTIKAKTARPAAPSPTVTTAPAPVEAPKPVPAGSVLKAVLLTLENVPKTIRNKVDPQSQVYVNKQENGRALVTTAKGNTFHIPVEDLDFLEQ